MKITLSDISNLQNENSAVATLAANNDTIETAFDNTLSRDGTTPNQMGADLDMNSNRVLNLPLPLAATEPVRLQDITVSGTVALGTMALQNANNVTISGGTLSNVALGTPTSGTLTNCTGLSVSTGISGLAAGVATFLATPTSANLIAAVTNETGTGSLVFATSPTLVTPLLGTPTSGVLTNCTGLPLASVTGLGTGVATALAINVGSAGAFVTFNGALGTPSSGTLTNATGLPISTGVSGLAAGVATFLATPSSANLRTALTDETGTGAAVFATSPALTTPVVTGVTSGSAATGVVGEVVISSGTSASLTTATPTQAGTISLTAGDWDISAQVQFNPSAGTSVTDWYASLSTTSATVSSPLTNTFTAHERVTATTDHSQCLVIPPTQVIPTSTTSYYINVRADFTGTAPNAFYVIRARRMR